MKTDRLIPSMFHRRLALLMVFFLLGGSVLLARVARLTVIDGADLLAEAERRLVSERWIETTRGRILDRKGRVLAMDRPAFDVAVDYEVITGEWALQQAARAARRAHADEWLELSPFERDALIEAELAPFQNELEQMWTEFARVAGVDREELERRKNSIIADVNRMAVSIWERRRLARQEELSRERETIVDVELADVARPIREQREAHVLLHGVDDVVAFDFRKLAEAHPGLSITDGVSRVYPHETMDTIVDLSTFPAHLRSPQIRAVTVRGVATEVIGWTRNRVFEEDIERREQATGIDPTDDLGRYLPGDAVGSFGLEKLLEVSLRGARGRSIRRLDTGVMERINPIAGRDAQIAFDVELQANIQAILDPALGLTVVQDWHGNPPERLGQQLAAGVAVVDVATGDTLALASTPGFTRADLQTESDRIFGNQVLAPAINRAFARPYEPGSIVKPLTLVTAVSAGVHSLDTRIACHGHLLPNRKDIYRCWIYRDKYGLTTHSQQLGGPLDGSEAIARSCNIYFYTLGRETGPVRMANMYEQLAVGRGFRHGLELGQDGFIGRLDGTPLEATDAIFLAMGQGPVSWTPLHAANAYATLARRGEYLEPALVTTPISPRSTTDFGWNQEAVRIALEGLWRGVNEDGGTGHHLNLDGRRERIFNASGVRIAGKTGTAQAAPIFQDADGDGEIDRDANGDLIRLRSGDHSWTAVLVGPEGGEYTHAIAVVVEYGGSGSRVAGPIANQVVHALQRFDYLPGAAP